MLALAIDAAFSARLSLNQILLLTRIYYNAALSAATRCKASVAFLKKFWPLFLHVVAF